MSVRNLASQEDQLAPNNLDLARLSPKSLKDLLLTEYKKPDVQRAVLAELTERNDATLFERATAVSVAGDDGPSI